MTHSSESRTLLPPPPPPNLLNCNRLNIKVLYTYYKRKSKHQWSQKWLLLFVFNVQPNFLFPTMYALTVYYVGLLYEMWPDTENKTTCLGLSMGDQQLKA